MAQSQVPNISDKDLIAAQPTGFGQALQAFLPAYQKGVELSDVLKRRKLEQQKLEMELQEKIAKQKQAGEEQKLRELLIKKPVTPTSQISTVVPQAAPSTLGQLPSMLPGAVPQPLTAPSIEETPVPYTGLLEELPAIEAKRQQDIQTGFARTYPEKFMELQVKQQLAVNKNAPASEEQWQVYNSQWHDINSNKEKERQGIAISDLPKGLTHQELSEMVRSGGLTSNTQAIAGRMTQYSRANDIREIQFRENKWAQLEKELNALKVTARSAVGVSAIGNQRAARALDLLNNPGMTTQLLEYVNSDLGGIMAGGVPHVEMLNRTTFGKNLVSNWANLKQRISSEPSAINIPEIRALLKETIQGILQVDNEVLDINIGLAKEGFLDTIKSDEARFERMVGKAQKIKTLGMKEPKATGERKSPGGHSYSVE